MPIAVTGYPHELKQQMAGIGIIHASVTLRKEHARYDKVIGRDYRSHT